MAIDYKKNRQPAEIAAGDPGWSVAIGMLETRVLERSPRTLSTTWEDILIPHGLAVLEKVCPDRRRFRWILQWADYHLGRQILESEPDYEERHNTSDWHGFVLGDYCGDWGAPLALAPMGKKALAPRHRDLIRRTADSILTKGMRLPDGTMSHGYTQSDAVWVDTLFYTVSPLAHAWTIFRREAYAEEAVRQCLLHARHLTDEATGLFFHDYQTRTGTRTNWLWGRGNGWMILALADVLDLLPSSTPGYVDALAIYRRAATALLRWQHPSGLWRTVLDDAESNLETSGTSLILSGLCIGVRNCWVEATARQRIERGLAGLHSYIRPDGALMGCQFPAGRGGWETHKLSAFGERTYGTGAAIRCHAEFLTMQKSTADQSITL